MEKHFFDMQVNSIERNAVKDIKRKETLFTNKKDIPEGENILLFEWVFSQKFKKGEKSRNGYKYMQNGWDVSNYATLPIILWQHDDTYGGIGFCQELYINNAGDLSWVFFVDLNTLSEKEAYQVKNGYVTSISTGAMTLDDAFEHNETGKIYTSDEAKKEFWFDAIMDCLFWAKNAILTYVVTKAELVENSLVTIWSNAKAKAVQVNSLQDEMKKKAEELKTQINSLKRDTLIPKDESMEKQENISEDIAPAVAEEVKSYVETPVTEEKEEALVSEEAEVVTTEETPKEDGKVAELENKLEALTNSFEAYKSEMEAKFNSLKKEDKISQREENRAKVKKIFETSWAKQNASDVKSVEDFKKKHFGN